MNTIDTLSSFTKLIISIIICEAIGLVIGSIAIANLSSNILNSSNQSGIIFSLLWAFQFVLTSYYFLAYIFKYNTYFSSLKYQKEHTNKVVTIYHINTFNTRQRLHDSVIIVAFCFSSYCNQQVKTNKLLRFLSYFKSLTSNKYYTIDNAPGILSTGT